MKAPEEPLQAEITDIADETYDTKTFTVSYSDAKAQKKFSFVPGQFMMVSIFGYGEIPISISSSPYKTESMRFTVVNVGNVTNAMHRLRKGDKIGLRGPYGNGFPLQKFRKKNIVFVTGGCGLAPLRSAIYAVQAKQSEFGKKFILFGCRTPANILFPDDQKKWAEEGFAVLSTVDRCDANWKGNTGVVTCLFDKAELPVENTVVLVCGPASMMKFSLIELRKKGFKNTQLYASLERVMQCGMGFCAHCNIGNKYTCVHGPVFSAKDLGEMPVEEE
ncbi:MAG: FAD/NAD(P)-binding protein [Candidatus Diapherotrites archaeon]|nr:FAD/NAD(P)-binding protein [Candidatus Diapherotrites archaeon]